MPLNNLISNVVVLSNIYIFYYTHVLLYFWSWEHWAGWHIIWFLCADVFSYILLISEPFNKLMLYCCLVLGWTGSCILAIRRASTPKSNLYRFVIYLNLDTDYCYFDTSNCLLQVNAWFISHIFLRNFQIWILPHLLNEYCYAFRIFCADKYLKSNNIYCRTLYICAPFILIGNFT